MENNRYVVNKEVDVDVLKAIWDTIKAGDVIEVIEESPATERISMFTVIKGGQHGN